MTVKSCNTSELLCKAGHGDELALSELFSRYRDRLKRMVSLRLNRRMQGRLDESNVLQEAFLEVSRKIGEYLDSPRAPFYLWLRKMTGLKLAELHRQHLGTQKRDAEREVSIYRGAFPAANSASLAAQLLGKLTSPSQSAIKTEKRIKLQEVLNRMEPIDREVLTLRHFEQLSNAETAHVLGLTPSGATARHMRAIKKLRAILNGFPEFFES